MAFDQTASPSAKIGSMTVTSDQSITSSSAVNDSHRLPRSMDSTANQFMAGSNDKITLSPIAVTARGSPKASGLGVYQSANEPNNSRIDTSMTSLDNSG